MRNLEMANIHSIAFELQKLVAVPKVTYGESVGKLFCDVFEHNVSTRRVLKALRFNKTGLIVAGFLSTQDIRITKPIPVYSRDGDARCKVMVVKNPTEEDLSNYPFYMKDLLGKADEYIVVDDLESISKGAGIKLLRTVVDYFNGTPIVLQAGFLYSGDYDSLQYSKELYHLPEELAALYSREGFINVNSSIGNYEDSIIMINYNNAGPDVVGNIGVPDLKDNSKEDSFEETVVYLSIPDDRKNSSAVMSAIYTLSNNKVEFVDFRDYGLYVCKCPRYAMNVFNMFKDNHFLAILPEDYIRENCPAAIVIGRAL